MLTGISISLSGSNRSRLVEIAADRNSPQKHVWRAKIVLLSADGIGTNEIMRRHRHVQDLRLALAAALHGDWHGL